MTTTLSPVTESEMNQFFHGLNEFKGRVATSIVAHSEQVQRIDALTQVVHELQVQVQALTNTIRQLTEDRDQARAERDRAVASERAALEMAEAAESAYSEARSNCNLLEKAIATLQNDKFTLEISNAELKEQNERQYLTLQTAIQDNQELQQRIGALVTDHNYQSEVRNRLSNELSLAHHEVQRLTNLLLGAKAVLEGTDPQPRREHAA